jgi:hypothetical protein
MNSPKDLSDGASPLTVIRSPPKTTPVNIQGFPNAVSIPILNSTPKGILALDPKVLMIDGEQCGITLDTVEIRAKYPYIVANDGSIRYDLLSVLLVSEIKSLTEELKTLNKKFSALLKDYKDTKVSISSEMKALKLSFDTYDKTLQTYLMKS